MSKLNELILRFVDYDDYSDTSRESVTGFFQSIAVLNSAFQKRINQLTSIHPSVPLGATLQEYINHQQELETKHGIFIEQRTVNTSVNDRAARQDVSSQSQASSAPVKSFTVPSGSETPPATTNSSKFTGFNMDAFKTNKFAPSTEVSPPSSDPPVSSKKRRAEEDDSRSKKAGTEPESTSSQKGDKEEVSKSSSTSGRSLTQNASGFFSVKPRPSSSNATQGDSDKSADEPKKSVFAGFGGLSQNPSADKATASPALNFGSLFGSGGSSFASTSDPKDTSKDTSSTTPAFPSFFGSLNKDSAETSKDASTTDNKTGFTGFSGFSSGVGSSGFSLGGFKFGEMGKGPTAKPAGEDEDNDEGGGDDKDEADVVSVIPVEEQEVAEPDALVSKKCKILYLDEGAWKSRGSGTAHLKSIDDNAVQLIVRAGTSLGAVLLNVRVGKDTKINRNSRKGKEGVNSESVDIFCLPFPVFKGVKEDKPYQFVLKFKDAKEADEFYGVVESVRK